MHLDPDLVVIFSGLFATIVGYQISRAIRARVERPSIDRQAAGELGEMKGQLSRLEQAVDSIAVEVERISEAQRFTAKLLNERHQELLGAPSASDAGRTEQRG